MGVNVTWLVLVLCYLLGSIPTAYIASRLLKGRDIRQMGDTNMGAANAFRQIGAASGITVGVIDASNQPPLYFLFLRGWIHLFGTSEIALRSLCGWY